jgi:hypothetical protein
MSARGESRRFSAMHYSAAVGAKADIVVAA